MHMTYTNWMRVLLTEGSGLTSRQVAGLLVGGGHDVGVASSDPIGLTRFTRGVRWHRISPFAADPMGWLDSAIDIYRTHSYDVLFPTQEQVAVLAARPTQLRDAGVATAVPSFASLGAVQDKLAARTTLQRLDLPQPDATVLTGTEELAAWDRFPVYVKTPIGTATSGVHRIDEPAEMLELLASGCCGETFTDDGVLVQSVADGPLVMVQSVFDQGRLVAFHANLRIREGARGGASHKRSIHTPATRELIERLGTALGWHGALSADIILTDDGPSIIDINPRLVEPANAHHSGVDLVQAMIDVAQGNQPSAQPDSRADTRTHQLLLAVLGAAQHRRRRDVAHELWAAATHQHDYANSTEELAPFQPVPGRRDWRAPIPLAAAAVATLLSPHNWRRFASTSVSNYALTPQAWRTIREHTPQQEP